jgi:uncharacterized Rmd1/YagE family protein
MKYLDNLSERNQTIVGWVLTVLVVAGVVLALVLTH